MRVLNVLENVPHGEGHRRIALKTAEACEKTPVLLVGPFTPPPRVAPVLEMLVKRHWVGLLLTEEDRSGIGQLAPAAQPHMGGGGGGHPPRVGPPPRGPMWATPPGPAGTGMSSGSGAACTWATWALRTVVPVLGPPGDMLADLAKRVDWPRRDKGGAAAASDLEGGGVSAATRGR